MRRSRKEVLTQSRALFPLWAPLSSLIKIFTHTQWGDLAPPAKGHHGIGVEFPVCDHNRKWICNPPSSGLSGSSHLRYRLQSFSKCSFIVNNESRLDESTKSSTNEPRFSYVCHVSGLHLPVRTGAILRTLGQNASGGGHRVHPFEILSICAWVRWSRRPRGLRDLSHLS